jgi:hypothetical protein
MASTGRIFVSSGSVRRQRREAQWCPVPSCLPHHLRFPSASCGNEPIESTKVQLASTFVQHCATGGLNKFRSSPIRRNEAPMWDQPVMKWRELTSARPASPRANSSTIGGYVTKNLQHPTAGTAVARQRAKATAFTPLPGLVDVPGGCSAADR